MRTEELMTASPTQNRKVLEISKSRKVFLKCNGEPGPGYLAAPGLPWLGNESPLKRQERKGRDVRVNRYAMLKSPWSFWHIILTTLYLIALYQAAKKNLCLLEFSEDLECAFSWSQFISVAATVTQCLQFPEHPCWFCK